MMERIHKSGFFKIRLALITRVIALAAIKATIATHNREFDLSENAIQANGITSIFLYPYEIIYFPRGTT